MKQDFKVKDINQANFGRKEISIAETEMPGLMALRDEYKGKQPLKGAKILGCLHMTIQTAVLIENFSKIGSGCTMVFLQRLLNARSCSRGNCSTGYTGICMEGRDRERILVVYQTNN